MRESAPAVRHAFAARLAESASIEGPAAWTVLSEASAWRALAQGRDRQAARWAYARSLIGRERGPEALGVLDVMQQDDPDLRMVDAFRLARGAALTLARWPDQALTELVHSDDGTPLTAPEACAWRMRLLAEGGRADEALDRVACAWPALRGRDRAARRPFLIAAARAAVEGGRPTFALRWLASLPDRDAAANLYRARAYAALKKPDQARLRLARVLESGTPAERADARLASIEMGVADGTIRRDVALARLASLRFGWRSDPVEERSLRLTYRLAHQSGDVAASLAAGAALLRYFDPQRQPAGFATGVQADLAGLVAPGVRLPLDRAAGLFWDYRDLVPGGPTGDAMVSALSAQLQRAGLYDRAAALLEYQLFARADELSQGPLSARAASLFILAGRPDHALTVLGRTDNPGFTEDMVIDRRRVEAIALFHVGRMTKALAVLDAVPDAAPLRAELLWKRRNWAALATAQLSLLPATRTGRAMARISDVDQAIILRQAIALAMLGQGDGLVALHDRYAASFAVLPTAGLFAMLTGPVQAIDPVLIGRAMAALPSASPAGSIADLVDAPSVRS